MTEEEISELRSIVHERACVEIKIAHILESECTNSFGKGENVSVNHYKGDETLIGFIEENSILSYIKEKEGKDVVKYERDKHGPVFFAKNVGEAPDGSLYLFPSRKLGKEVNKEINVMVKIPHLHFRWDISPYFKSDGWVGSEFVEGVGGFIGAWTNEGVYFRTIWKDIPTNVRPPELRNLLRIFDCADIYGQYPGALAGYPNRFPKTLIARDSGVSITVSEQYDLESLAAMDRGKARSILMENGNIYGLYRALYALQDLDRPDGTASHMLIHCRLRPENLFVKNDGETGETIVKIGNWASAVCVPVNMANEKDAFILNSDNLWGRRWCDNGMDDNIELYVLKILGGILYDGFDHGKHDYSNAYTAPELLSSSGKIDVRKTDLFSLSLLIFEILALDRRWYETLEAQVLTKDKPQMAHKSCTRNEENEKKWSNFVRKNLEVANEKWGLKLSMATIEAIVDGCRLNPQQRPTPKDMLIVMGKAGLCPEEMKGVAITEKLQQKAGKSEIAPAPEENEWDDFNRWIENSETPIHTRRVDEEESATEEVVVNNMADAADAFPGNSTTPELPLK
ncbi:MAG: hypothetical protein LBU15_01280 [Rickettsiales bacterium]|nr:hypothetical protein [Rickettsiales bacterium]